MATDQATAAPTINGPRAGRHDRGPTRRTAKAAPRPTVAPLPRARGPDDGSGSAGQSHEGETVGALVMAAGQGSRPQGGEV